MKKLFFTSLVAVIAIGGAFGTNSSKVFSNYHYYDETSCNDVNMPVECGIGSDICTVNGATLFVGSCASPDNTIISKPAD